MSETMLFLGGLKIPFGRGKNPRSWHAKLCSASDYKWLRLKGLVKEN